MHYQTSKRFAIGGITGKALVLLVRDREMVGSIPPLTPVFVLVNHIKFDQLSNKDSANYALLHSI